MNVYILSAIDSASAAWRVSSEQDSLWVSAPDAGSARRLAASATHVSEPGPQAGASPWEDERVTSCVLDPTLSLMRAGTVVRQDGSRVGA